MNEYNSSNNIETMDIDEYPSVANEQASPNPTIDDFLNNWPNITDPVILDEYFREFNRKPAENNTNNMFGGQNSLFTVKRNSVKTLTKWQCTERTIELETTNPELDNFLTAGELYYDLFNELFKKYIEPTHSNSKIRILLFHEDFQVPINLSFMDKNDLTVQMVFDAIDKTVQSKKKDPNFEIQSNKKMSISIIIAENPKGSGRKFTNQNKTKPILVDKNSILNIKEYCLNLQSVHIIKNNDNLCLLRAFLVGKSHADKDPLLKKIKRHNNSILKQRLQDLLKKINFKDEPCGLNEIKILDDFFPDYQIMVINNFYETIYLNSDKKSSKFIYLLYNENHFDVILSMKSFYKRSYWCDYCKKAYNNATTHRCRYTCKSCFRVNCEFIQTEKCQKCNIYSRNSVCSEIHNERVCSKQEICKKCDQLKKYRNHVCIEQKWCKNCNGTVELDHKCFVMKTRKKNIENNNKFSGYIFFDFEAFVNKEGNHEVNLAMAQKICNDCLDKIDRCKDCELKHIFYNIDDYCNWALRQQNTIQIAHNMKAYDGIFILNFITNNMLPYEKQMPQVISNSTKIISLKFRTIKIIDSLSFLPMALEKFSKTFDIIELKKGFFPHDFNKPENYSYVGLYPDAKYYNPNFFSVKKKLEFENWYEKVKNTEFNFQKEFENYCWSDVQLFAEGCLKF